MVLVVVDLPEGLRPAEKGAEVLALGETSGHGHVLEDCDIMIGADEAHALGLVTWVTPANEIDGFADELADRLAAAPPFALAQSKALLNDGATTTLREALANEARAQPGNFATADSADAYAAFAAKKDPEFTGRWAVPPPGSEQR